MLIAEGKNQSITKIKGILDPLRKISKRKKRTSSPKKKKKKKRAKEWQVLLER